MTLAMAENNPYAYMNEGDNPYAYMAENNPYAYMSEGITEEEMYEYFVPVLDANGNVSLVREDYFDNLSNADWMQAMSEGEAVIMHLQECTMSEEPLLSLFGFGKAAKARRAARRELRMKKKEAKIAKKVAKGDAIRARAEAKRAGGGGFLDKVGDIAGNIFGGGKQDPMMVDTQAGEEDGKKQWYQSPVVIIGGVVAAGLLVYAIAKPKKSRR